MESDSEIDSLFPAAAATCLINFSLSVGAMPTACPLHALAGTNPVRINILTPIFIFNERAVFPDKRESDITLFPSRRLLRLQMIGHRAQINSQGSHTRCRNNSFLASFLKPFFQILAGSDFVALSFFSSFCVGCTIVKGDHAPDCGVAQGVIHGVPVRHGEKQEEEEGEVEQEVEGNKEEEKSNTTAHVHG